MKLNKSLKLFTTIVIIFLIAFSCTTETVINQEEINKADSISIKLNSPELKAVNQELLKDPSNGELYHKRSLIYFKLNQLLDATGDALRAIRIDSVKANYYLSLADIYFAQNKTKLAKETLELI
jgi:tetratricopeptide (TPR) repeat protein